MVSAIVDTGLGLVLIVLWSYVMYDILLISMSEFGGKYTTVFPYFLGSFAVLLVAQVVEAGYDIVIRGAPSKPFFFGLQTLQFMAGVFLVIGVYQLYQIEYATTGFFDADQLEGDQ